MAIYVNCAGTNAVNGVYYFTSSTTYANAGDSRYYLDYDEILDKWTLYFEDAPADPVPLYILENVTVGDENSLVNETFSTILANASNPQARTFSIDNTTANKVVVANAGSSEVNGTYTYYEDFYGMGGAYIHEDGTFAMRRTFGIWILVALNSGSEGDTYYTMGALGGVSEAVPISTTIAPGSSNWYLEPGNVGSLSAPISYIDLDSCFLCTGGGTVPDIGNDGSSSYNFYVQSNGSAHHINKVGSSFYIRKKATS